MKPIRWFALLFVLAAAVASAQVANIGFPAGSPEDQALQAISNEADAQKRIAMLEEFVKTYAANPQAVAYGNWQLSQNYQAAGDLPRALDCVDKALAALPDNVNILASAIGVAQQAKDNAKIMDYASRVGAVVLALEKQSKPEGMSDEDFARRRAADATAVQQPAEFAEVAAYNVISGEQNARNRLQYAERFAQSFPRSKYLDPVMTLAIISLQEMNDTARMAEFADKALAANPNNVQTLVVLANAFAEDQKGTQLAKAGAYARKAIELTKADDPSQRITAGFAHEILGYVLLREEKTAAGIGELKIAADMLADDPAKLSIALYRLGFGYAKLKNYEAARAALTRAATVDGPFKEESKKLLEQVNAARRRPAP